MRYTKKEEKDINVESETKENNKFNLQECFVLWKNESKNGNSYLRGFDFNKNKLVGFIDEKATNTPKIRIYSVNEEGRSDVEVISLWEVTSKKGNIYLSGKTNEDEKIIAYYGDLENETRPYVKGYFKEV